MGIFPCQSSNRGLAPDDLAPTLFGTSSNWTLSSSKVAWWSNCLSLNALSMLSKLLRGECSGLGTHTLPRSLTSKGYYPSNSVSIEHIDHMMILYSHLNLKLSLIVGWWYRKVMWLRLYDLSETWKWLS